MEKRLLLSSFKQKKDFMILGIIWSASGMIAVSLGAVRWFHFPYLLFLDEWHFVWASVPLACGLFFSQLILDQFTRFKVSGLILSDNEQQLTLEFRQILIQFLLGLLGIILLEVIMILWGISSALRGLVNLGIGIPCLWSSRFYWLSLFQIQRD
jgi:hypothetical protein